MKTQTLLSVFQNELVRRGLPAGYARDAAEEVADHHRDVVEELCASGMATVNVEAVALERLGDVHRLVKKSVRAYQRRHWCGRWPLVTFLLGTPIALFLSWSAIFVFLFLLERILGPQNFYADMEYSWYEWGTEYCLWIVLTVIQPTLIATLFAQLANRNGFGYRWVILCGLLLAATSGCLRLHVNWDLGASAITWPLGSYATPPSMAQQNFSNVVQALQLLMPISFGLFTLRNLRAKQRDICASTA